MNYQEKAYEVISRSLKSAIFIDEKAREFYQREDELTGENEETLSLRLFSNFKSHGISLAVHRFTPGDETNTELKKYLLGGRDLVLLDWKLNGEQGEEYALSLLSEIVRAPHINYCALYTSQEKVEEIFFNIISYFSGKNAVFFAGLRDKYDYHDELKKVISDFNPINPSKNGPLVGKLKGLEIDINELMVDATASDIMTAIKYLYISFQSFHLSSTEQPIPDVISYKNVTLVINNTIVTVLQKEKDNDVGELIKRISDQIAGAKTSFTQLLGVEMQSIFATQGSFIDSNLLKVSLEALLAHRKDIKSKNDSDIPFKNLIKNVLIEHATMQLRTAKLALLEDEFLDEETKTTTQAPTSDSLAAMNVFYNSVKVESIKSEDLRSLNFGDVFSDGKGSYFICITALCDCYLPSKIENIFFFAKGNAIPTDLALTLGDAAFMSFLPDNKVVSWIAAEPEKFEDLKEGATVEDQVIYYKRQSEFNKQYKFKPVYIKPVAYNVKSPKIIDNKIEIARVETKKEQDLDFIELTYITTVRPNYTQRIANHAFSHPVRVGVDFVKFAD